MRAAGKPGDLRRLAGWAFVGGLCLAALVAIVALLSGSFSDTDLHVIGTSLGFSVFSSTGAAGGALRRRPESGRRAIGTGTVAAAVLAFVLLVVAIWLQTDDWSGASEDRWRAFGVAGLIALWSGHASLVIGALRASDSEPVRSIAAVGVVALGVDTAVAILAVVGTIHDIGSGGRWLAALLVVALLCTALPPILRRLQPASRPSQGELADGVAEVADRLGAMELPPQAHAEVARLRELVVVSRRSRT